MVRHSTLRKIICANALVSEPAADLGLTVRRGLVHLVFAHSLVETSPQYFHGFIFVLMLRALVLTRDDFAGGDVRNAHGGIGLVDVLPAGPTRAESIDP